MVQWWGLCVVEYPGGTRHSSQGPFLRRLCNAGAGQPQDDSIRAHHGATGVSAEATPAGKAALAAVLRPQTTAQQGMQGDKTPEKLPQRRRQDSNASLMDTPEPRTLVKFPSQRASRQSGIARALSFWSPQPDVLSLE